ncbi:N-6 DNA methylase [Nonomuraea sp. NPDC023979]|uniref:N-6 DNA methylase n=1 Tax=Nonomuraea sp. NPDC023979 TaxID=3154796 RepID=UPI0033D7F638
MRPEADLQADIKQLLTTANLNILDAQVAVMEQPLRDGTRRRIDIEIGHAVIEVKRDLRRPGVMQEAIGQLKGYVEAQTYRLGTRYVGILTDGAEWHLFHLAEGSLSEVARLSLNPSDPAVDQLLTWLEAILATREDIRPTPAEIKRRLGADSPAYKLDHASLLTLYETASNNSEIRLKKDLWAKLLRTALGSAFTDDDKLFVDHTLLVLTAEVIAHAVLGFDLTSAELSPQSLVRGESFSDSDILGVVEADFFDWVLEVPSGREFVSDLARRLSRFDWSDIEHDVLKVLYESVINQQTRKDLGEYYTPDWLAERMVSETIKDPLHQRVMDPSCGSGTFLFHAIKAYLRAADESGMSNGEALAKLPRHVIGVDVHPVSVTLARVTYLMAIGADRLSAEDREALAVPVYLGDSVQWEQNRGFISQGEVSIPTAGSDLAEGAESMLFGDDLVFPERVLADAQIFDRLVAEMADRAISYTGQGRYPSIRPVLTRLGIHPGDWPIVEATFATMCRLHADGRNHIWGYYVRNYIRPIWLARPENRVDVLIGNPPWLAYRFMTPAMQRRFTTLSKERKLVGKLGISGRDLSALFVTRAVELYLKVGGSFAFVMPRATLSRQGYEGFRTGAWMSPGHGSLKVSFDTAWDLEHISPNIFPVPSAVIRAVFSAESAKALSADVQYWEGRLPAADVRWITAESYITVSEGYVHQVTRAREAAGSPYRTRFRQGAVLIPRALLFCVEAPSKPLGAGSGRKAIRSRRTTQEKPPWSSVPDISANVESQFVHPVHLGETVAPFRALAPLRAVVPIRQNGLLEAEEIEEYPGLAKWWNRASEIWDQNKRRSDNSTFLERIDFHRQLSSQVPASPHRVVYTKAGNNLAAARIKDVRAIIDQKLYWGAVSSVDEAHYLVTLLNSDAVHKIASAMQSRGLFGGRDFDKYVWYAPIPLFDSSDQLHLRIAALGAEAETAAANLTLTPDLHFRKARETVLQELERLGIVSRMRVLVEELFARAGTLV